MGPMGCPDLSVKIYHYKLCKIQKSADSYIFSTLMTSSKIRVCMTALVARQRGRLSSQCDTQPASVIYLQASLVSPATSPAVNFEIYIFLIQNIVYIYFKAREAGILLFKPGL